MEDEVLISVAICSHHPRPHYMKRVIDALAVQTLPREKWEAFVIDNASEPPLVFEGAGPIKAVVREEKLGLVHARLRAISLIRSPLVVFIDDDNVVAPDYLEVALELARLHPKMGVFAASIKGEFEVTPSPWCAPYLEYLGVSEIPEPVWSNYSPDVLPVGAGMVVRRETLDLYARQVVNDEVRLALGRRAGSLLAGEDTDVGLTAYEQHCGCGRFPELKVLHLIPADRIGRKYLRRLVCDVSYSHKLLYIERGVEKTSRQDLVMHVLLVVILFFLRPFHDFDFRYWRMVGSLRGLLALRSPASKSR